MWASGSMAGGGRLCLVFGGEHGGSVLYDHVWFGTGGNVCAAMYEQDYVFEILVCFCISVFCALAFSEKL